MLLYMYVYSMSTLGVTHTLYDNHMYHLVIIPVKNTHHHTTPTHTTPFQLDPRINLYIGPFHPYQVITNWKLYRYLFPSVWRLQCRVGGLEHGLEWCFLPSLLHKEQRQASLADSLLNNSPYFLTLEITVVFTFLSSAFSLSFSLASAFSINW